MRIDRLTRGVKTTTILVVVAFFVLFFILFFKDSLFAFEVKELQIKDDVLIYDTKIHSTNKDILLNIISSPKPTIPQSIMTQNEWLSATANAMKTSNVKIIKLTKDEPILLFEKQALDANWWVDDSGKNIYISTLGFDESSEDVNLDVCSIYKSNDSGKSFVELNWYSHDSIIKMALDKDGQRGYALSDNNHIYKIDNNGIWHKSIKFPEKFTKSKKNIYGSYFDTFFVDEDASLYISTSLSESKVEYVSYLLKLPWSNETNEANEENIIKEFANIKIRDMVKNKDDIYFIIEKYDYLNDSEYKAGKTYGVMSMDRDLKTKTYMFDTKIVLDKIYTTKDNKVILTGSKILSQTAQDNIFLISKSDIKEWHSDESEFFDKEFSATYFDKDTNIFYGTIRGKIYQKKI